MKNYATVVQRMNDVLKELAGQVSSDFSGIGLIVWDERRELQVTPLKSVQPKLTGTSLTDLLLQVSSKESPFHDGFHVLNTSMELIAVAMYFSPPIVQNLPVDREHGHGGRYFAACFGSTIPGVVCTAALSQHYGPVIFQGGLEWEAA